MRAQVLGHSSLYRILPTLPAFILIPCTSADCKTKWNPIKWKVKKETQVRASIIGNVLQQWLNTKKSHPWDAGTPLLSVKGGQTACDTQGFSPAHLGFQRDPGKTNCYPMEDKSGFGA